MLLESPGNGGCRRERHQMQRGRRLPKRQPRKWRTPAHRSQLSGQTWMAAKSIVAGA